MPALPRLALAVCLGLLGGCAGLYAGPGGPGRRRDEAPAPPSAGPPGPPTALLSAHVQPPRAADRDYVLPVRATVHLVFSRPVDPLTLVPQQFVLALADGRRVAPVGVSIGAGPGEQVSVALLLADTPGDGKTPMTDPISVTVTGLLHDADGRILEGLATDIAPRSRPVYPVRAEPVAPGPDCKGLARALRVLWSAPVARPEVAPWPVLERSDGTRGPAQAVVGPGAAQGPALEYCAAGAANVVGVELPAGVVVDERGQASAPAQLRVG